MIGAHAGRDREPWNVRSSATVKLLAGLRLPRTSTRTVFYLSQE